MDFPPKVAIVVCILLSLDSRVKTELQVSVAMDPPDHFIFGQAGELTCVSKQQVSPLHGQGQNEGHFTRDGGGGWQHSLARGEEENQESKDFSEILSEEMAESRESVELEECIIWWELLTPQAKAPIPHALLTRRAHLEVETMVSSVDLIWSAIRLYSVGADDIGRYTCHVTCAGEQTLSRSVYVNALYNLPLLPKERNGTLESSEKDLTSPPSTPPPHRSTTTAEHMCARLYSCNDGKDRASTTMAGMIALLIIVFISAVGCVVAMCRSRNLCCLSVLEAIGPVEESESTTHLQQSPEQQQQPEQADPDLPPRYEDIVPGSPPPTGLYQIAFPLPQQQQQQEVHRSNNENLTHQPPNSPVSPTSPTPNHQGNPPRHTIPGEPPRHTIPGEPPCHTIPGEPPLPPHLSSLRRTLSGLRRTGSGFGRTLSAGMRRSSSSASSWHKLPSYFSVIRDWALRGIHFSRSQLSEPPPLYADVEKHGAAGERCHTCGVALAQDKCGQCGQLFAGQCKPCREKIVREEAQQVLQACPECGQIQKDEEDEGRERRPVAFLIGESGHEDTEEEEEEEEGFIQGGENHHV